jgi:hypothetical protein
MHSSIALLSVLAASAIAKAIPVMVGQSGLVFSPDTVTAAVGNVVELRLFGSLHTVVQGDSSTPCSMGSLAGKSFNSGPINNAPDGTVSESAPRLSMLLKVHCFLLRVDHDEPLLTKSNNSPTSSESQSKTPNPCGSTAAHHHIVKLV